MTAAEVKVGTMGTLSSVGALNFSYILVVDGNGATQRFTGYLGGSDGPYATLSLPPGSGYRFRLVALNALGGASFGGQVAGISVSESDANVIPIPTAPISTTPLGPTFAPGVAGTERAMVFEVNDPSGFFEDATNAWIWGYGAGTSGGYALPALFYSSALAQTQVEKLGGQVYRLNFPAVPAMPEN
jgi:hypothetical protein